MTSPPVTAPGLSGLILDTDTGAVPAQNDPTSLLSPSSTTLNGSFTSEIDVGGQRIRVLRSADDLPPPASMEPIAEGDDEDAAGTRLNDVFCTNTETFTAGSDTDDATTQAGSDIDESAEGPETFCVLGSRTHIQALAAKVAALDKELSKYKKELGSAEAIHAKHEGSAAEVAHHGHAAHVLEETFGALGAEIKFIEKHEEEEVKARITKRRAKALAERPDDFAVTFQDVIYKRPVVKQYFKNGVLHRSPEEHKTTWLELFFDLIYVAIIADLGHHFSAAPSWTALSEFFVLFGPVFKTWQDMNQFNNVWSQDDLSWSAFTFWIAILSMGMGTTASGALPNGTARIFVGFYLVNRLTMLLLNLYYMFLFPKFVFNFVGTIIQILVPSFFWLAGFFTFPNYSVTMALWWTAVLLDLAVTAVFVLFIRYWDVWACGKWFGWRMPTYRTALNIEHTAERMGLLIILALGEYAVAILYTNIGTDLDFYLFGKAIFGLLIAMCLRWVYFDGLTKISQHALRRHALAGVGWMMLHFPLSGFIILNGSTSAMLISLRDYGTTYNSYYASASKEKPRLLELRAVGGDSTAQYLTSAYAWAFCATLAVIMVLFTVIAACHVWPPNATITPSWVKRGAALTAALIVVLVPLAYKNLSSLGLLAITGTVSLVLIVFEMFAAMKKGKKRIERTGSV